MSQNHEKVHLDDKYTNYYKLFEHIVEQGEDGEESLCIVTKYRVNWVMPKSF